MRVNKCNIRKLLNQAEYSALKAFYASRVTGSSEHMSKILYADVTFKTGFATWHDKIINENMLGKCWTNDCCGVDRGEFYVWSHFKAHCSLMLSTNEKFIALCDNSDLNEVCNILFINNSA